MLYLDNFLKKYEEFKHATELLVGHNIDYIPDTVDFRGTESFLLKKGDRYFVHHPTGTIIEFDDVEIISKSDGLVVADVTSYDDEIMGVRYIINLRDAEHNLKVEDLNIG